MRQRSWFLENSFFYTLLAIVVLLHLIFLFIRLIHQKRVVNVDHPVLKVHHLARVMSLKNRIVRSEDSDQFTRSKSRSFLSDKNRSFERETRKQVTLNDLGAFNNDYHPFKKMPGIDDHRSQIHQQRGRTTEFVEQVPLGDHTYLNTVEYKYYGFFKRMRERLEQAWGMSLRQKAQYLLNHGRRLTADNLLTSINVILNEKGELVHIVVKGSSGVLELDDAALESFNRAGPFSHPPKGLLKNGLLEVSWGFLVNPD